MHSARARGRRRHARRRQDRRARHDRRPPGHRRGRRHHGQARLVLGDGLASGSRGCSRHAERCGHPIVYFGATGGARIPDTLGSAGFSAGRRSSVDALPPRAARALRHRDRRRLASAARRSSAAGVRPRRAAARHVPGGDVAAGRRDGHRRGRSTSEALGGVDVHARTTGQIDPIAEHAEDAYALVRRFLSLLPRQRGSAPRAATAGGALDARPRAGRARAPRRRARAYDMTRVLRPRARRRLAAGARRPASAAA